MAALEDARECYIQALSLYKRSKALKRQRVELEREIAEATARDEGKPEAALPKIVEGRVTGFFKETCLLDQDFAKDSKQSVGKVLENAGLKVTSFVRFRVGA